MPVAKTRRRGFQPRHKATPRKSQTSESEIITRPVTRSNNQKTKSIFDNEYYIINMSLMNNLINDAFINHVKNHPHCKGKFELDITEKRLISSSWKLKCMLCTFESTVTKLYREDVKPTKGRNISTLNRSLGCALIMSSIAGGQFSEIMLTIGVHAGTVPSLSHQISSARPIIKNLADQSMAGVRRYLAQCPGVPLGVDGWYNNKYRNTPGQAATQAVFTTVENLSGTGKIVDCLTKSKLCRMGTVLRNKGKDVVCPDTKSHACTATMGRLDSIAQEGVYSTESLERITADNVKISSVTSDGDVKIKKSVARTLGGGTEMFHDLRHISKATQRAIKTFSFSDNMFVCKNKTTKKQRQSWFADDIKSRLEIEFNTAEQTAKEKAMSIVYDQAGSSTMPESRADDNEKKFRSSKLDEIQSLLKVVPDTIVNCIKKKNNCGICCTCLKSVAPGGSPFLMRYKGDINMNAADEDSLKKLMLKRIGPDAIKCTYMKQHTQKNEAFNRSLSKTCPKIITNMSNLEGRVSAAVLVNNEGLMGAHMLAAKSVNHEVSENIKLEWSRKDAERKKHALRKKSPSYKNKRFKTVINDFQNYYDLKLNDAVYEKGTDLPV